MVNENDQLTKLPTHQLSRSEIEAEAEPDDARRDDLRRIQVRRADGDVIANDRARVADVEQVELRHDLPRPELERTRDAQVDHRHTGQAFVAASAERHDLAGARERDG